MMLSRKGTLSRKTRASMRRRQGARGGLAAGSAAGGYPPGAGGYSGARRCSVPNLKPLDATLGTGLPCKSDTDLSGSGKSRLASLQEEHARLTKSSSASVGGVSNPAATASTTSSPSHGGFGGGGGSASTGSRVVSFYGATGLLPTGQGPGCPLSRISRTTSASAAVADSPLAVDAVGVNVSVKAHPESSLRLYGPGSARTASEYSLSSVTSSMASGCKVGVTTHSILVKSGSAGTGASARPAQTRLSSLRAPPPVVHVCGVTDGDVAAVVAANGVGADTCKPTPPPSEKALYESTVVWAESEDPDQAYSVLGSLCEAGVENSNPCDFILRAFFILSGTWPVTVFLVGLLALPLVMTTIGVNYLHECPVEPKLPIYLVVGGCFGIVKLLFLLWKQMKRHKEDMVDLHDDIDLLTMTKMTNIALNIFLLVWFAFGHYWVFSNWKPHFVAPLHEPRNWCDETVFMFCFWQLIVCHCVLGILLFTAIVMCCCFICVKCLIADAKR